MSARLPILTTTTVRARLLLLPLLLLLALPVPAAQAATCADHATQAEAQAAADTRDGDGDGRYCESLPCPCAGDAQQGAVPRSAPAPAPARRGCTLTGRVQPIGFSATKYPTVRAHYEAALARGWPVTLVLNRPGADARRRESLSHYPTREGMDRDEYPPAVGRGRGRGLERGSSPRGWIANVDYVPASENRSHGAVLGTKLRRFCDGQRFRYVFY